ncbi:MAG: glycosyltransferase family 4 protein [Arcicella sp.]|nr:glycosyltransferase family 4 protein [Arcicella sp.]
MNMPSYYQNDLFNELCKRYDNFEVIYAHEADSARKKQGWNFNLVQNYESKIIGKNLNIKQLIQYVYANRKSTHIINGIWAEKYFFFVLLLLMLLGSNFFIYSEAPVPQKKRSFIKKLVLNCIVKPVSKRLIYGAKGFFAVSIFAVNYFKSLNLKSEKIYRFGYFRNVEKPDFIKKESNINQLIFVGQLIERKGIFMLLEAVKNLVRIIPNFHINIIGSGILENQIKQYVQTHHLENFITLRGVINSENIAQFIQKADLLILPSVFDGWGIVVNEALQNHVPVLISDQCGAKELIRNEENGLIFEAQNTESLTKQLSKFLQFSSEEKSKMKSKIIETTKKIEIPVVADYMVACLDHAENITSHKPTVPWL